MNTHRVRTRNSTPPLWQCGRFALPLGRKTYVMGIVNATPDSFSGDGASGQNAVEHALAQMDAGADILDIGGQSTRPGASEVSPEEELSRVIPLIENLRARSECDAVPLSIDTTKSTVARAALEAGADIVNDISGATFDAQMLSVVSASTCGLVLMHLRGTPQTMTASQAAPTQSASQHDAIHDAIHDVITEILEFWENQVRAAKSLGIEENRIALDAGFGFGKSVEENLAIIRRGRELRALGFATLSGTSRKSTIGRILNDAPVEERLFGTASTVALAIGSGADIVRVHDVAAMRDVARVADAICRI